jgi:hypothetical protein
MSLDTRLLLTAPARRYEQNLEARASCGPGDSAREPREPQFSLPGGAASLGARFAAMHTWCALPRTRYADHSGTCVRSPRGMRKGSRGTDVIQCMNGGPYDSPSPAVCAIASLNDAENLPLAGHRSAMPFFELRTLRSSRGEFGDGGL